MLGICPVGGAQPPWEGSAWRETPSLVVPVVMCGGCDAEAALRRSPRGHSPEAVAPRASACHVASSSMGAGPCSGRGLASVSPGEGHVATGGEMSREGTIGTLRRVSVAGRP